MTQPEIEAVLLTALFGVIVWAFHQWRKSRRELKVPSKSKNFSPTHQLPSPPANFIGRNEELAELEKELASAHAVDANISVKHIALQGMGGVGKTALATVLAHKLKKHYPDAQLCLNLHGANLEHHAPLKPSEAMQSIIHAFRPEAKLPEELDKLTPIYNGVLNDAGRVMLFLDDAADAEQIRSLLPPANCLLLTTSRIHFSLPGLAWRNIHCLHPEESQKLLLKLAPRIKGYEEETAELCGHLPLALEVFAGTVNDKKLHPVHDLLERLRKQPDRLTKADAAFQTSYDLLGDDLHRCLRLLAVFPASFNLAAATAVWKKKENSAREVMQTLLNASFVEWDMGQDRFHLHDLLRQFCNGKLDKAERTAAELRYTAHYLYVGVAAEQLYLQGGENVIRGLELFDRERTHIEAAFEYLVGKEGHSVHGVLDASKTALQLLAEDCPPYQHSEMDVTALLASMLDIMGNTGNLRFHPRQRISWLESQLLTSRLIKNHKDECRALGYLGVAYFDLGHTRKAIEFYNQALTISRDINYQRGKSGALGNLGIAYQILGETDKAIKFYEEVQAIARETGNRENEGAMLINLGEIFRDKGDCHRADELFNEALSISCEIGSKRLEATALVHLGIVYSLLDDIHKAVKFYEQSLIIFREIRDRPKEGIVLTKLGDAYALFDDYHRAIQFYQQALLLHREVGDLRGEGRVLCCYALALNALGDRTEAIAVAEKSLDILEATEDSNVNVVRENLAKWRAAKP
ncbi:MAG: tetratricopeptide repeat protein [Verrucomicrobiota bacterium]